SGGAPAARERGLPSRMSGTNVREASDIPAGLRNGLHLTRRRFFGLGAHTLGAALGTLALDALAGRSTARAEGRAEAAPGPHFRPRAKRVIYLHMEGAPSQLDLFDHKPGLRARFDEELPDSIRQGQRLTT